MKPTGKQTILQRIAASMVNRLLRHVTWHGGTDHNLAGEAGRHYPFVLVLGREHYKERRRTYPALRRRDLEKVLRQELAGEPLTLTLPGPVRDDRREVGFYTLDQEVAEALLRSPFIVPESVVLGSQVPEGGWVDVERQDYRYFLFGDGSSQPAGGALAQRELVALAAGVDPELPPDEWQGSAELLRRIRSALPKVQALTWWSCRNPVPRDFGLNRIAWKPLLTTAGVMVFAYFVLTSLYLQASLSQRESALEVLAPQIQEGLVADNEARAFEARREALNELWSSRGDTQRLWQAVGVAIQNRAVISQVDLRDSRISLRGEAPDASEVLAVLADVPGFADVAFDAPVRAGRSGRQSFALSFSLTEDRGATGSGSE
ncbi:MAG: hypothetical protein KJO46_08810 [Gammaproteobacteria bacterium]|nr:hypothetical protein [Gammaproteobacteria bacterium]